MTTNRIYKNALTRSTPTSLKGAEAARRKRERELNRQQEANEKERELKAIVLHERAKHAEAAQQAGVAKTVAGFARRVQLSDKEARLLENIVENQRRTFCPTPEQRTFDVFSALDHAIARVKPQEHIARNQGALTREQRISENETYAEKLKRLGLQNPAFPSVPSGIST